MREYRAPWSRGLVSLSAVLTVLCVCIGATSLGMQHRSSHLLWTGMFPLVLIAVCALFTIRGYSLTRNAILVHRLLWATQIPRRDIQSACFQPEAMRGSIRTFGNGGFYSFSGFYWNKRLGAYRAFVTDPRHTVVLQYRSGRTVLLSPEPAEEFVRELGFNSPVP